MEHWCAMPGFDDPRNIRIREQQAETDLATTNSELALAKTDLADTKAQLVQAQSDVSNIQGQVAASQTSLTQTQAQLASAQSDLANTKAQLVTTQGQLATAQTAPVITGISPTGGSAAGGDTVTITGSGFTGITAVAFGLTPAASFTFVSDTQLTAVSPPGSGPMNVRVTTPLGSSAPTAIQTGP